VKVVFRLKTVVAAIGAMSALALGSPAPAAQFLYTVTGLTTDDVTNLHGESGSTLPVGEAFTLSFLIDDALPTAHYSYGAGQSSAVGGGQYMNATRPPVSATLTVGSYSYTIRSGDLAEFIDTNPGSPDATGILTQELDLGSVEKNLSAGRIDFGTRFNRNEICCLSFSSYNNNSFDWLDLSLISTDFASADFRETGTFALGAGSTGSFLSGFDNVDRLEIPAFDYVSTGLSASQLTVAAVPEPHTWAIMIAGVGFIGMSLRARTARPSAGNA
jgi:hypothetical protein